MVQTSDELLTVKEAAAILKLSPYTIYRWVGEGRLPAVRYSRRVLRLRRSDVESVRGEEEAAEEEPPRGSPAAVLKIAGILADLSDEEYDNFNRAIFDSRSLTNPASLFDDELPG